MNAADTIRRIKDIEARIVTLEKILKRGEYLGAGVQLTINVGPVDDDQDEPDLVCDLGLTADLQKLLELTLDGLRSSRAYWVKMAHDDYTAMGMFLDAERAGKSLPR